LIENDQKNLLRPLHEEIRPLHEEKRPLHEEKKIYYDFCMKKKKSITTFA